VYPGVGEPGGGVNEGNPACRFLAYPLWWTAIMVMSSDGEACSMWRKKSALTHPISSGADGTGFSGRAKKRS
jgi:hypothetical protein